MSKDACSSAVKNAAGTIVADEFPLFHTVDVGADVRLVRSV